MTVKELYAKIGGNYDHAVQIMRMDRLIEKYIRKLTASPVNTDLQAAGAQMDPVGLFENAHAMKGVCGNLGLDALSKAASDLSEEFRPGNPRTLSDEQVKQRLAEIDRMFQAVVDGISSYFNG